MKYILRSDGDSVLRCVNGTEEKIDDKNPELEAKLRTRLEKTLSASFQEANYEKEESASEEVVDNLKNWAICG